MLAVRDAIPKVRDLAKAEFATLRLKLLKIAAVVETASRVRLAFAAACPEAAVNGHRTFRDYGLPKFLGWTGSEGVR